MDRPTRSPQTDTLRWALSHATRVLLVVTYSRAARRTLRNVCRRHEDAVAAQFGRAALLEPTAFAALQALRCREKHGPDVAVHRVGPLGDGDVPADVRQAARAYEDRETPALPYRQFAAGTEHPDPETLRERALEPVP